MAAVSSDRQVVRTINHVASRSVPTESAVHLLAAADQSASAALTTPTPRSAGFRAQAILLAHRLTARGWAPKAPARCEQGRRCRCFVTPARGRGPRRPVGCSFTHRASGALCGFNIRIDAQAMKRLYALMLAGARGVDFGALPPTVRTVYPVHP